MSVHDPSSDGHAGAARRLLDLLTVEQREAVQLDVADGERREWTYLPGERPGVALADLGRDAAAAALRLLAAGLSEHAYAQAATIMALEDVLDTRSGSDALHRHRGDYWVALFGDPGADAWGWRVGGHHVSVHVLHVAGEPLRVTPLFLGANPARTAVAGRPVAEPLGPEEALGFELLAALDRDARSRAVISDTAPDDIVTRDASSVGQQPQPTGVPIDRLPSHARGLAEQLVDVYLDRLPGGALRPPTDDLAFAWAGGSQPGEPHYYRLQGRRLLVELDNTQDGANHVHSVVRDLDADFGEDVLAEHLRHGHGR